MTQVEKFMSAEFKIPHTMVHALQMRAQVTPERIALRFLSDEHPDGFTVTYAELDQRARAIAVAMLENAQPGDRAILLFSSGLNYVAAFFGCLYAGIIAVPAYPPESARRHHLERLLSIMADAQPRLILTSADLQSTLTEMSHEFPGAGTTPLLCVDTLDFSCANRWQEPLLEHSDIAFLQYTSGSTSMPKGVQVSHGNLVANGELIRIGFNMTSDDVMVSWLPLYHDMGLIGCLLQAIYSGFVCVLMSPQYFLERPVRWLEAISRFGGTVSGGPDFAYRLCVERVKESSLAGLKLDTWQVAFSGSEPIRPDSLNNFAQKFAPAGFTDKRFFACYGLAEATLFVTGCTRHQGVLRLIADEQSLAENRLENRGNKGIASKILIGCGIAQPGHPVLIVDPHSGQPVADGDVGEIWVSGPSIALGYWNNPEATAKTFVTYDERIWLRTGDLGAMRSGELYVTGRLKDMMIVRGQNIYPQDIERIVEESVASVRKGRVAAFSVIENGQESIGIAAEIGRSVQKNNAPTELINAIRLAVAAIYQETPAVVALLNPGGLPKTSSGKLQRSACRGRLASGDLDCYAQYPFVNTSEVASATEHDSVKNLSPALKHVISNIWCEQLQLEQIADTDNFFLSGGNSVTAAQTVARLREALKLPLHLRLLFDVSDFAGFVAAVANIQAKGQVDTDLISPVSRHQPLLQSPAQQRLWFLWQKNPSSAAYNIPGGLRLRGELDEAALQSAFNVLIERHESLRTRFYEDDGVALQRIDPVGGINLRHIDLSDLPETERATTADALREQEALESFNLQTGPLLRLTLIKLDDQEHWLLLTVHHIIADGWSFNVLVQELAALYKAATLGETAHLAATGIQYADFAHWHRQWLETPEAQRQKDYWLDQLEDTPEPLQLPTDYSIGKTDNQPAARYKVSVPEPLAKSLKQLAQTHNTTVFMVLLGAFQSLLHRYSGQDRFCLGVPSANRQGPEVQGVVGFFINTLSLKAELSPRLSFSDLLARVRVSVLGAQANQDLPFNQVIEALPQLRERGEAGVFQVMFNHQQRDLKTLRQLPGLLVDELPWHSREAKFALQLQTEEDERGRLTFSFDYASHSYELATIRRMADHFSRLLTAVTRNPEISLADIPLLDVDAHEAVLAWGRSSQQINPDLLPARLLRQAALAPDAVALQWEVAGSTHQLNYADLDLASNQLAHYLQQQGVGPDVCVGIMVERSPTLLIGLLAIIKAGGTYVPLDADYPVARLAYMLADSGSRLLLTQHHLRANLGDLVGVESVDLDTLDITDQPINAPSVQLFGAHLAYIIYTSGTTGQPKGVAISHAALMDRLAWMDSAYPITADDVFLQKAPVSFDVSVWECFLPLIHGRPLVLAAPGEHRDPKRLIELVQKYKVTRLHFVPSLLQVFADEPQLSSCSSLRYLFAGGEALAPSLRDKLLARLPGVALYNRYGPTESTINITQWHCQIVDGERTPIGRPVGDAVCRILDGELQSAPVGIPGELYLGGIGLARGYLGRAALTAERFIPDPESQAGERLYRSGDKVRWNTAQAIDFLGRIDQQVKVRGFRIELEEIAAHIQALPGVSQAVVVVKETPAGAQLAAYYTGQADAQTIKVTLERRVPAYMVPAHILGLAHMPVSPSGKLDRHALPEPEWQERQYRAPRNLVEQQIAAVWQEILGLDNAGLDDNFFELGGHSLLATRIVARVRHVCDVDLPLSDMFDTGNLEQFAQRVAQARAAGLVNRQLPILPADRSKPVPLSYSQQRMWFLWQLDPTSPAYNVGGMARLTGKLDVPCMDKALKALVARHETLRTRFPSERGVPFQSVDELSSVGVIEHDFSAFPEPDRQQQLQQLADSEAHQPFDLEQGPLLRFCLVRMASEQHIIVLTLHHIVIEGWAMDIFARELGELYEAFVTGNESPLQPLAVQYLDYTLWQRQWMEAGEQQRQLDYWVNKLGDEHPVLDLPADRPRPPVQSHHGGLFRFDLDEELAQRVRAFNNRRGLTMFMTSVAALATLLYRYTGQSDLRIGAPVANRIRPESEGLIGAFLNTQVLRCELDGLLSVDDLLEQVRTTIIEAQSHQDLPFDQLVEALKPPRSAAWNPLFQVMCNVQRWEFQQTRQLADLTVEYIINDPEATKFDLNLEVTDLDNRLGCCLTYSRDLFDEPRIVRMAEHWRALLAAMVDNPAVLLGELPLCSLAEQRTLQAVPGSPLVHRVQDLFLRQALANPGNPAVTVNGKTLSYEQLNQRVNQLAHLLRAQGIGPETRVGLAFERSFEMVIGLLAILKAGGAYVPMDPEYPRERLLYLIEDSGVKWVLGNEALFDVLGDLPAGAGRWCLEEDAVALDAHPITEPVNITLPQHAAYVIYTSGSTGKPKGVVVSHGEIASHSLAVIDAFGMTPDDCELHFYSISFDAATERLLTPLLAGAHLVVREQGRWDAEYIHQLIRDHNVSILGFTPGYGAQIAKLVGDQEMAVRLCITGGEALTSEQVSAIRAGFHPTVFFNAYGPTETVVMPLACRVPDDLGEGSSAIPIGTIIGDRVGYILDASLALVPQGAVGELYVGGAGLARGYHQRPGLTADRFIPDPFSADSNRLYRTGDLVRLRKDGLVEYVGRVDHQVKIRGFRIELGEIEMQLRQTAQIDAAAVLAIDFPAGKQLVAYLATAVADQESVNQQELIDALKVRLRGQLPDYMVPSHYVLLNQLPLTPNGKLDRAALPLPELQQQTAYIAPRSALEQSLAGIWSKVLNYSPIGMDDNFFELGGDSILSIQLVSLARQAGIYFTPRNLLQYQTIGQLAAVVTHSEQQQISQASVEGELILTPIQRWFFESSPANANHWNQSVILQPREHLDAGLLAQTLLQLVNHHDALRLRFTNNDGQWRAQHSALVNEVEGLVRQVSVASVADAQTYYQVVQQQLDIAHGPLIRALLVDVDAGHEQRLLLVIHHLAVDGVSWRILLDDLQRVYGQLRAGENPVLPQKTHAFRDWGLHLQRAAHSEAVTRTLAWWQAQLQQPTIGKLRCDNPQGNNLDASSATHVAKLDATQTRHLLQDAAKPYRTRIDELLLTALARVLSQWSGSESVLVQLEGHGREDMFGRDEVLGDIDLTRSVGWFTNAYPLCLTPGGQTDPGTAIKAIKEQVRAVPHKGLGFGLLRYLAHKDLTQAVAALPKAQITFNYLGQVEQGGADAGLFRLLDEPSGIKHDPHGELPNDISLDCQVFGGELVCSWTYSQERYQPDSIASLAHAYVDGLTVLIAHCLDERAGGLTPSDFPLATLSQQQIDNLTVPAAAIENIYPLTPMQEGMLLHTLLESGNGLYYMQDRYQINSPVNPRHFAQAWQEVVARHEILRASFCWNAGDAMLQVIHKPGPVTVDFLDWSGDFADLSSAERDSNYEQRLQALLKTEREAGFDLLHQPPFHLRLIRLGENRYWFMMSNHHILIDAWCRSLLMGDFFAIYTALGTGQHAQLPAPSRYSDYIQWLQARDYTEAQAWWRNNLQGFSRATPIPTDRPIVREHAAANGGMKVGDCFTQLTFAESARLRDLAQGHQLTVNTFAQAAWGLVLRRLSGDRDLAFGVTVAGRPVDRPDLQHTVGLFINSIPLRLQLPQAGEKRSVQSWLQGVFAYNMEVREYEYLSLVDIQSCSDIPKGLPLFDSLFVFENAPVEIAVLDHAREFNASSDSGRTHTNFPLTVVCYPGDELRLHISYDQRYFDESTITGFLAEFKRLLLALAEGFQGDMAALPILADEEREYLTLGCNQTARDYPLDQSYARLFEQRVAVHPERIVASQLDQRWTYRELNNQANRLAHNLVAMGVNVDQPVALLAERSFGLLTMMVGTFKAGAGYLPLDPGHPTQRLLRILDLSRAPVLICDRSCLEQARELLRQCPGLELLLLDDALQSSLSEQNPGIDTRPDNLAYVIYTSGSTGQPKGVMVEQQGMLNNQLSKVPYLQLTENDVIAQTASQSFDISVWQFLTAPLFGGRVDIVPNYIAHDPSALLQHVPQQGITVVESVPAVIQGMLEAPLASLNQLRWMLPTGEVMPAVLAARWIERYPAIGLVNAYGPAECSDDVALFTIDKDATARSYLPVGVPTDNNRLYLLDDALELVPDGAIGEIHIAGTGVGRGYVGDPAQTALRFVPNPFSTMGERLYRSGDLGRRTSHSSGSVIECIGRVDQQIKIRGYRIELGEIEAQLQAQPDVREVAVAVQEGPAGNYLVCYLVPADSSLIDGQHSPTVAQIEQKALVDQLKERLRARLPDYMVPLHWQILAQLPRNANGKLDRKALRPVEIGQLSGEPYLAPRTPLEHTLTAIWCDVLKVNSIGVRANFFELGGHSLLATQIASRVQQTLQRNVPLRAMFECTTIEALAEYIETLQDHELTAEKVSRLDDLMAELESL